MQTQKVRTFGAITIFCGVAAKTGGASPSPTENFAFRLQLPANSTLDILTGRGTIDIEKGYQTAQAV